MVEIKKFIKFLVQNNQEEIAIEVASKISKQSMKDESYQNIIEVLLKWKGNEKDKSERYDKARKLVGKILDQEMRNKALASFP